MSETFKVCPICGSRNHRNATLCVTCGTTLGRVEVRQTQRQPRSPSLDYDYRYGETDLFEGSLVQRGRAYLVGALVLLLTLSAVLVLLAAGRERLSPAETTPNSSRPLAASTNTPRPTVNLATVTPGPPTLTPSWTASFTPTATITPSPAPCIQIAKAGDDLITLAYNCGHRSLDVIGLILEINGLADPTQIQVGQAIEIPWPTPTLDLNATPTETPAVQTGSIAEGAFVAGIGQADIELPAVDPFGPPPTKTLQPGVMWHRVRLGENIISIALQYGANVEILSQLNPEVTFSQCDFSLDSGGGNCIVPLFEGQLLRVPAPTATPTIPPTPSGSETPTPTATATFNAPSALSPVDRAFFRREELVTLRWIATGTLGSEQAYHVQVENLTTGEVFSADTREIFFIVPTEWQGKGEQRYEYRWTVSVIDFQRPEQLYYATEPRTFTWEGS